MSYRFSFVELSANEQTPIETLHVLFYELGRIVQCLHYTQRYGPKGYKGYAEGELADAISMCRMYGEQKGVDSLSLVLDPLDAAKIFDYDTSVWAMSTGLGGLYVLEERFTLSIRETLARGTAISRILFALRHVGHRNAWSFEHLVGLGEERYRERMRDLKKHGIPEQLKEKFRDCPGKPCEGCASEGTC